MKPTLVVLISLCALASQAEERLPRVEVSNTEKGDFPAGGTLRVEKPVGEIWIEGWDQPGFEITTRKFIKADVPDAKIVQHKKTLDDVKVIYAIDGTDLVVRTDYSHRFRMPIVPYPAKDRRFDIEYWIRIPRTAGIKVNHQSGELHIDDVLGDVTASVSTGLIAIRLPSDRQLAINAKSTWGGVISDFSGTPAEEKTCTLPPCSFATFPFGHRFEESAARPQQKLQIRTGFGDILILKESTRPANSAGDRQNR